MKKFILLAFLLVNLEVFAQVAINKDGTPPDASAMLDVKATDAGFLLPRLTQAQRDSISNPVVGLIIYCTDFNELQVYNGESWTNMTGVKAVGPVTNFTTGEIWVDRNLGASQVATSNSDAYAYGNYYNPNVLLIPLIKIMVFLYDVYEIKTQII